jgi:hypothetical protein
MQRSIVLLPLPLPPISANIEPRRTVKLTSRNTTLDPKANVKLSQLRRTSVEDIAAPRSDAKHIRASRENRVQCDDADYANDDRGCGGPPHFSRAATGAQTDTAA